jgi:hypothetical protein
MAFDAGPGKRCYAPDMQGRWLLGMLAWLAASACQDEPVASFRYDPKLPNRLAAADVAWDAVCARKPAERIGLPAGLHEEQQLRPTLSDFVDDLEDVIEELPRPFAKLFEHHVCAVLPMFDAPMSGTLAMLEKRPGRSLIYLNVEALSLLPNSWLEFKEASAFDLSPDYTLVGKLAEPDENIRRVLLEYVLVHELAHVVDGALAGDPTIADLKRLSFPLPEAMAARPVIHYPERMGLPRLPGALSPSIYEFIASSALVSPAALDNANEDFAESIATYMHNVMRRRPWKLELLRGGQVVVTLRSCWEEPRCAEKRRLIEELLRRWETG